MNRPPRQNYARPQIVVSYSAVDGYRAPARVFATLAGARRYAHERVGRHPEIGSSYAVSGDGVGKVTVRGCTLAELFPPPEPIKPDPAFAAHVDACNAELDAADEADRFAARAIMREAGR